MMPATAADDLVAVIAPAIHGTYSRHPEDEYKQMIDANAAAITAKEVAAALAAAAGIGDLRIERVKVVDEVRFKAEIFSGDASSLIYRITASDLNDVAKSDGDWLRMSAADFASIIASVERATVNEVAVKVQRLADHHESRPPVTF